MRKKLLSGLIACAALLCSVPAYAQQARGTSSGTSSTPLHATRQAPAVPPGAPGTATGRVPGGVHRFGPGYGGQYWPRQTPLGIVVGPPYHYQSYPFQSYGRAHVVIVSTTPAPPLGYAPVTPYAPSPVPPPASTPARESCAIVTVLQPGSRGFWKELRLPAAGAHNTDELQRILDARLEEGVAFRIRDAAGEWLEIPPAAQLERIVVERCA